jgi:putative ABC transport system permease protein
VGEEDRGLTLDLVREHPSVTVIDIDAALEQVRSVMDQAALAVQYVFLFALLAGVVAGVVIVGATGLVATRRVVNHPPVEVLRTF